VRPLLVFLCAFPVVAQEWLTGSVDLGYRWRTDVAGSFNTYRSVVNLGEGPKLFGTDFTIIDPSKRFFDRLTVNGIGWGGDPYTTAHASAEKQGIYRFIFDYRNIAYFNAMPSFANPLLANGIFLNQQSFDTRRRMADFELELRPGSRFVPYLKYTRDSDHGTGITDFVSNSTNSYPVANFLRSHTDNYRGGLRMEFNRFHATLEEGGTVFKDDEQVTDATRTNGNASVPFLGQTLYLNSLLQAYGIRGAGPYTKAQVTASPASWIDFHGQFLYSLQHTDAHYTQNNTGEFVNLSSLLFYNAEQSLLVGVAKQPHTSGSMGVEVRPWRRLRIIENWTTDRLHTASSVRLVDNYNQQSLDVTFDLTSKIALRAGERYVWGDTTVPTFYGQVPESGTLSRHSGVAGISFRSSQKLSANFDFEGGSAEHLYYRTSLQDYRKYRARARYQVLSSLFLTWNLAILTNDNPIPSVQYTFSSHDDAISLLWTPGGGKRISLLGEYSRTSVESNILYILPQIFAPAQSFYRENAHQASGLLDFVLPSVHSRAPHLSVGGALFAAAGTRPTSFYQPLAKLSLPIAKHFDWVSEWRWYDFAEPVHLFEGFRTTQFSTGLRIAR
jgi:hypothetical protein